MAQLMITEKDRTVLSFVWLKYLALIFEFGSNTCLQVILHGAISKYAYIHTERVLLWLKPCFGWMQIA